MTKKVTPLRRVTPAPTPAPQFVFPNKTYHWLTGVQLYECHRRAAFRRGRLLEDWTKLHEEERQHWEATADAVCVMQLPFYRDARFLNGYTDLAADTFPRPHCI